MSFEAKKSSLERGARQPPTEPGIVPLLDDFPFVEFTDDELIQLFEISGFKLGDCYDGKLIVINYLRGFHKDRFETVMTDLCAKKQAVGAEILDISSSVMLENC